MVVVPLKKNNKKHLMIKLHGFTSCPDELIKAENQSESFHFQRIRRYLRRRNTSKFISMLSVFFLFWGGGDAYSIWPTY